MPKRQLPLPHIYKTILRGRTSASVYEGSITVEAAMAVPIFFFGILAFLYLMQIMCIQTTIRSGVQDAGKLLMAETSEVVMMNPSQVEQDIVDSIGADRLERSIILDGSAGIDCTQSYLSPLTGCGHIIAKYKVRIPLPVFHEPVVEYEEAMKIKTWTGYQKGGLDQDKDKEDIVYLTENGVVYHKDYHCTYLELSIHMAAASEVNDLRNVSGEKYHPCEKCMHGQSATQSVYITDQGNRYHNSLSCSGLKRIVYSIPISEAIGKRACSKCGK